MEETTLDLVVAGTSDAVLMVESEAQELPEDVMLAAVNFGHDACAPVIDAIINLAEKAAKDPWDLVEIDKSKYQADVERIAKDGLIAAYKLADKGQRQTAIAEIKSQVMTELMPSEDDGSEAVLLGGIFKSLEGSIVRGSILETGIRIDGRDTKTVRPILSEVGVLPRTHGSALFTRGETQAIVVATLGTGEDEQFVDRLEGTYKERFLLHYNFPPYSVGEVGRSGFTSRREIGHGKLAWRAIHPMLPSKEEFPYTLRVVSEITESKLAFSMEHQRPLKTEMYHKQLPLKMNRLIQ